MRTFIAIELSENIREALSRIQSHLKYSGADFKWVGKDNIHLTLKFLGEIPEGKLGNINSSLDKIAASRKHFEISLRDIGAFPDIDHVKILWVGIDKCAADVKTLADEIDSSMSGLGFEKETRPFAAHLTIGRARSPKNGAALKEKILLYNTHPAEGSSQLVSAVTVFKSVLTPGGPIYTKLHESRLS